VDYYRGRGILLELSTDRPEAEVQADLRDWLQARGLMPSAPWGVGAAPGTSPNGATEDRQSHDQGAGRVPP